MRLRPRLRLRLLPRLTKSYVTNDTYTDDCACAYAYAYAYAYTDPGSSTRLCICRHRLVVSPTRRLANSPTRRLAE